MKLERALDRADLGHDGIESFKVDLAWAVAGGLGWVGMGLAQVSEAVAMAVRFRQGKWKLKEI